MRTLLVAMIAVCLAIFPAGMSRALAPVPVQPVQVTAGHGHGHDHRSSPHEHASSSSFETAALETIDAGAGDCPAHGTKGKNCADTCCGFACHAYQPVVGVSLGIPLSRSVQPETLQDDQVGGGLPFSIERPPRSV